jgi:hypothetical protein
LLVNGNEIAEQVLPLEPRFSTDEVDRPLQAADMLAWFFRRRAPNTEPEDNQFDWLLPKLFTMPISEFSSTFTGEAWAAKFQETYSPSLIDRVERYYDDVYGDWLEASPKPPSE